jgi:hypothetical protein
MNHERNKAQVAYLFTMGRAPSQEGAPLVTLRGLTQKLLAGGALLLRRVRPFSGGCAPSQGAHSKINQARIRHNFA